ncbi:MAG: peptidoglycan DD-metalloendopeptidase family protein, partial [Myxococcota bacterium]
IVAYSDNGLRGFGNCLLIVHPNGWVSVYAHNYRNTVQAGWRVTRGERIGFVGRTGIARGPHLHFELRVDGRPVNPAPLFRRIPNRGDRMFDPSSRPEPSAALEEAEAQQQEALASLPHELGTVELARHVMAEPVAEEVREPLDLRWFRNLLWPLKGGELGRGFEPEGHRGIDMPAERGAPVRAAADGVVLFAGEGLSGLGEAVLLLHKNGWVTLYGGNGALHVEPGDRVLRGEWIAEVGARGRDEKPHLHFELHDEGALRDPAPLLMQVPDGAP